ncbi:MAG: BON domain-containing protein [Pyrinomonadaceae bacterium]
MKYVQKFILMAFAVAMLSFVTVNAQTNTSSLTDLEKKVRKEILMLPNYGLFDSIGFKVDGGTVTLYGKTASLGTMKSAERVVKRIPGVTEVVNNIDELPPSSFDNQIRQQIVREFVRSGGVYPYIAGVNPQVRIIVENGRVSLEGYVPNKGTSNLMYLLANRVPGTFAVTNNLVIS